MTTVMPSTPRRAFVGISGSLALVARYARRPAAGGPTMERRAVVTLSRFWSAAPRSRWRAAAAPITPRPVLLRAGHRERRQRTPSCGRVHARVVMTADGVPAGGRRGWPRRHRRAGPGGGAGPQGPQRREMEGDRPAQNGAQVHRRPRCRNPDHDDGDLEGAGQLTRPDFLLADGQSSALRWGGGVLEPEVAGVTVTHRNVSPPMSRSRASTTSRPASCSWS